MEGHPTEMRTPLRRSECKPVRPLCCSSIQRHLLEGLGALSTRVPEWEEAATPDLAAPLAVLWKEESSSAEERLDAGEGV